MTIPGGRRSRLFPCGWNTPTARSSRKGGRTRALAAFGLQDGQNIQAVRPDLGTLADRAPTAGAIVARLEPEDAGDPAALEQQIISDIEAFDRTMQTAMQPWWNEWNSLTAAAKALWENRGKILKLFKDLADGSVAAFETGFAALSAALQGIPGLEEIAGLLKDLVGKSAEWAGAMIELATRTRVLAVLGANVLGVFLMIPPNLITDIIGNLPNRQPPSTA